MLHRHCKQGNMGRCVRGEGREARKTSRLLACEQYRVARGGKKAVVSVPKFYHFSLFRKTFQRRVSQAWLCPSPSLSFINLATRYLIPTRKHHLDTSRPIDWINTSVIDCIFAIISLACLFSFRGYWNFFLESSRRDNILINW